MPAIFDKTLSFLILLKYFISSVLLRTRKMFNGCIFKRTSLWIIHNSIGNIICNIGRVMIRPRIVISLENWTLFLSWSVFIKSIVFWCWILGTNVVEFGWRASTFWIDHSFSFCETVLGCSVEVDSVVVLGGSWKFALFSIWHRPIPSPKNILSSFLQK